MKRLAFALVMTLLFSVITVMRVVNEGRANPLRELGSVPPDSKTKPPMVIILSPMNNSVYTTNPPILSVNVTLPESSTALGTILYFVICETDWQENEIMLYRNSGYANSIESQIPGDEHHYFEGSLDFEDLPDGNHTIAIVAVAGGWYPGDGGFYRFAVNGSSTVFFTKGIHPTPLATPSNEPQSTEQWLILGVAITVAVVLVGLGLLVYLIKRK